ncbi:transposase, partial [Candidatus Woesearchaeota archaeon]|nr:transposase [Candidatus Woesearchaeota archaeon]
DDNHVHMVLDLGIKSKPELAKKVKGFVGRKFFMVFPELKKSKAEGGLFWNSGLWSPASYGGTPENVKFTVNYVKQQKYGSARGQAKQYRLTAFVD